jgi:hypothetical protein
MYLQYPIETKYYSQGKSKKSKKHPQTLNQKTIDS